MLYNLICYTWLAILLLGQWHEWRSRPKKVSRNIGKRRARAAKRHAEYARLEAERAVIVPIQQSFWTDYQ
jgi:hypothetical protein